MRVNLEAGYVSRTMSLRSPRILSGVVSADDERQTKCDRSLWARRSRRECVTQHACAVRNSCYFLSLRVVLFARFCPWASKWSLIVAYYRSSFWLPFPYPHLGPRGTFTRHKISLLHLMLIQKQSKRNFHMI